MNTPTAAPMVRRAGSAIVNGVLSSVLFLLVYGVYATVVDDAATGVLVGSLLVLAFAVWQWQLLAVEGADFGHIVMGTIVVDESTLQPIGWKRAFVRTVVFGLVSGVLAGLGAVVMFVLALRDPRRQAWHDKAARSVVVPLDSLDAGAAEESEEAGFASDRTQATTVGSATRGYLSRIRGGDMGALPAGLGLLVLFIVFGLANDRFLSNLNMANLITQSGAIIILAMALVPVLLLGDIDLSAGVAGGTSAAVMGLLIVKEEQSWVVAVLAALLTGAVIGLVIGVLVAKLGIPSFVVTLAFFLGLQGVILKLIGDGGSVRIDQKVIAGITNDNMSVLAGWISAVVIMALFAVLTLLRHRRKVTKNLQHQPLAVVIAQIVALSLILALVVVVLNSDRGLNNIERRGIPYVLPVVAVMLIVWTFILGRTRWGRHVYAVGGNAEAARRAGIRVDRIRVSVFMACSAMAALSGIIAASNSGKVSTDSGGGNALLYAVGAAVIGGTSLFGGKGKARDAVIGGLVIATIANGLGLLNQASYINFLVTGGVLLLAASVDALSRRRRSATGL